MHYKFKSTRKLPEMSMDTKLSSRLVIALILMVFAAES